MLYNDDRGDGMNQTLGDLRKEALTNYNNASKGIISQREYLKSIGEQMKQSRKINLNTIKPHNELFKAQQKQLEIILAKNNLKPLVTATDFTNLFDTKSVFDNLYKISAPKFPPIITSKISSIIKSQSINPDLIKSITTINNQFIRNINENFQFFTDEYLENTKAQLINYVHELEAENERLQSENESLKQKEVPDDTLIKELVNKLLDIYIIISQTLLKSTLGNVGDTIFHDGITQVKLDNWLLLMLTIISLCIAPQKTPKHFNYHKQSYIINYKVSAIKPLRNSISLCITIVYILSKSRRLTIRILIHNTKQFTNPNTTAFSVVVFLCIYI